MASDRTHFMFRIKNLASADVCRSGASQVFFMVDRLAQLFHYPYLRHNLRILRGMIEDNKDCLTFIKMEMNGFGRHDYCHGYSYG